jgi:hypothetical protein
VQINIEANIPFNRPKLQNNNNRPSQAAKHSAVTSKSTIVASCKTHNAKQHSIQP